MQLTEWGINPEKAKLPAKFSDGVLLIFSFAPRCFAIMHSTKNIRRSHNNVTYSDPCCSQSQALVLQKLISGALL